MQQIKAITKFISPLRIQQIEFTFNQKGTFVLNKYFNLILIFQYEI